MSSYRNSNPLSIALQAHGLTVAQPGSWCRFTGHSGLLWRGGVRPTPASDDYCLQIGYKQGFLPKTKVIEPELKPRGDEQIPHMYGQETLCLFNPNKWEWSGKMRIADTILPLACLWLYFYEIWSTTGEWHGGGDHPSPVNRRARSSR